MSSPIAHPSAPINQETLSRILTKLDAHYPFNGVCFLHYNKPWQLLFATILSAQCTDDRVNLVTATLFETYKTLEDFAAADLNALEKAVYSTGFFKMKAAHIKEAARQLLERHGGQLPSDMEALTALSGVGRKTANVVRSHVFKLPSVVVDTHVARVSVRLGLAEGRDPVKIEHALMAILPVEHWIPFNQQIITHGRRVCPSRAPRCGDCIFLEDCVYGQNV